MEIALQFFIYMLKDFTYWSQVFFYIQAIINNTSSSTTKKTPNKIIYDFALKKLLEFFLVLTTPNTLTVYVNTFEAILFALFNQKQVYNYRY